MHTGRPREEKEEGKAVPHLKARGNRHEEGEKASQASKQKRRLSDSDCTKEEARQRGGVGTTCTVLPEKEKKPCASLPPTNFLARPREAASPLLLLLWGLKYRNLALTLLPLPPSCKKGGEGGGDGSTGGGKRTEVPREGGQQHPSGGKSKEEGKSSNLTSSQGKDGRTGEVEVLQLGSFFDEQETDKI